MTRRGGKRGGSLRLTGENAFAELQARLTGDRPRAVIGAARWPPQSAGRTNDAIDALYRPSAEDLPKAQPNYLLHVRALCNEHRIRHPVAEYSFHPSRRWRFDFAWPVDLAALEIEGGIFNGGAHSSVTGILRDIEKINAAVMLGWRVIRCLPENLSIGVALIAKLVTRGEKE